MEFINYLKSKLTFYVALSLTFIFASCGSYQYVGYDSDGIYGSDEVVYQNTYTESPSSNNNYYKNYFAEKSREFEGLSEDGTIFTDIDSYQGDYEEVDDSTAVTGYAGWGQDNSDVTINVYSNYGYSNWWYRPYAWNWYRPYWGWNSYWYDPFWNDPFFYGGGGFYGGFGFYSPFYGSYWNYGPYWNGFNRNRFYYNGYYGSRNIAYNAGRRGSTANYSTNRSSSVYNRTSSSLNRRSSSNLYNENGRISRSRTDFNSNTPRRRTIQNSTIRRNYNSSTSRPRVNNSSRPRINNSSRPNSINRSYSSPRRSNNSPSINRSSTRSNGSSSRSFSSGSSSRSSSGNISSRSSSGSSSRSSSGGRRGNQ